MSGFTPPNQVSPRKGELRKWFGLSTPFQLKHPAIGFSSTYRIESGKLEKTEEFSINWHFSNSRALVFQNRTGRMPTAEEWEQANATEVISASKGVVVLEAYVLLTLYLSEKFFAF